MTSSPPSGQPEVAELPPPRFHLLAKPSGSTCNLDCTYCFFLSKEALYPNATSRMSEATLEAYLAQLLEAHRAPEVTVAWQGGEPTLMGLDFFRRSVELVDRFKRPWQRVEYTIQTNGVLLDDEWCAFLKDHGFLVGLSVDGPQGMHDTYRVNRGGRGTHRQVMKALGALRRHDVDLNILCTVNAANVEHGSTVYRYFRDELGARFMQFIPIVERATPETLQLANAGWTRRLGEQRLLYTQTGSVVTERSVGGPEYGRFLVDVYEEWLRGDVGTVFVQLFDVTLQAYFGQYSLCVHAPTCGTALALEHNGDVYSCDHFVEPAHLLGNIHRTHMLDLVASPQQRAFGRRKRDALTRQCRTCDVLTLCHGGCPKDRFAVSRDGEGGHNHLCEGLHDFYTHTRPTMTAMARLVREGRYADEIMSDIAADDAARGRNDP